MVTDCLMDRIGLKPIPSVNVDFTETDTATATTCKSALRLIHTKWPRHRHLNKHYIDWYAAHSARHSAHQKDTVTVTVMESFGVNRPLRHNHPPLNMGPHCTGTHIVHIQNFRKKMKIPKFLSKLVSYYDSHSLHDFDMMRFVCEELISADKKTEPNWICRWRAWIHSNVSTQENLFRCEIFPNSREPLE